MTGPSTSTPAARRPATEPAPARPGLGRNVIALGATSFLTDAASEMIYSLLPHYLTAVLGASAKFVGAIEGAADSAAALLKLASGWLSDRAARRKPLVVFGYALAALVRPLVAVAQSAGQVLAIRVTDRVGKGIRNAPRDALIADSVPESIRGRAFGFHRGADHAGAVVGPLIAYALVEWGGVAVRHVFLLAIVPGLLSIAVLVFGVREVPRRAKAPRIAAATEAPAGSVDLSRPLSRRFWAFLGVLFVFTLGNSTDAFLLLRAEQIGVPTALLPVLWALLHVVKSASSVPGGALSDRLGRGPLIVAGWLLYAAVYAGFARATETWHAWALFGVYGLFFGLTEGSERALVADLVPAAARGTAFGWYNLAIAAGALPASLVFGAIWDRAGAPAAFLFGAGLALAAALGLVVVGAARAGQGGESGVGRAHPSRES